MVKVDARGIQTKEFLPNAQVLMALRTRHLAIRLLIPLHEGRSEGWPTPRKERVGFMASLESAHGRITAAGWCYRNNDRGWIIYRDPETGRWHTRAEAIAIVDAEKWSRAAA
jgi:hypothetical protein